MKALSEHSQQLPEITAQMLELAKESGATSAEAGIGIHKGLSVTVRNGEVETIEHNQDKGLDITVYVGQKKGSASTSDFSKEAIKKTVNAACDIAKYTEEDDCAGLADVAFLASEVPDLDLFHPWGVSADDAIEVAKSCESAGMDADKKITNTEGATVNSHERIHFYANSSGFLAGYPSSRHSISCALIGQQGESMQRDYWYTSDRDRIGLTAPEEVGGIAAERTISRLGARRIETCKAPVIFTAEVAGGLLSHFIRAISGGSLYRKSSFMLDKLGQEVFSKNVRIHEQPHLKKAMGSAPFDSEGVATRARDIVTDGVLQGYVLASYSARKLGMSTTGNAGGVHNLTIEPDDKTRDDLIKNMGTGLLVTELMGMGVNTVTGDYSRGATGFWVENGNIQFPVEEVTIAGNLIDMYKNLVAVGNDVDLRGGIRSGSILLEEMTIAGA